MPRVEATVSEVTVLTKASVAATLSDAKKQGVVRGRLTFLRISSFVARSVFHDILTLRFGRCKAGRDVHDDRTDTHDHRRQDRRNNKDASDYFAVCASKNLNRFGYSAA